MWKTVEVDCFNYRKDARSHTNRVSINKHGCDSDCECEECPMHVQPFSTMTMTEALMLSEGVRPYTGNRSKRGTSE